MAAIIVMFAFVVGFFYSILDRLVLGSFSPSGEPLLGILAQTKSAIGIGHPYRNECGRHQS